MASGSTAAASAVALAPLNDPAEMSALRRLYCEGPVLAAAQRLKIWPDSKDFVDTPTKAPASAVLRAWEENPPADDDAARAFIATWFEAGPPVPNARTGEAANLPDAANVSLRDWHPEGPPFALERFNKYIQLTRGDDEVPAWARDFAGKVHALWPTLARAPAPGPPPEPREDDSAPAAEKTKKAPSAREGAEGFGAAGVSTLISLPHAAIVPGERFRETYYWDSYWTVLGLIACGMLDTAEGVARNLLSLVERFGFVPNGARAYYLNRTQPPVLASTCRAVFEALREASRDKDEEAVRKWEDLPPPTPPKKKPPRPESRAVAFARFATPLLKKEHDYLTRPERVVRVDVPRTSAAHKVTGDHADMARYWAFTDTPRPESFREDAALAAFAFPEGADPDGEKARRLFRDVASAAESGHDFASRWLGDHEQALGSERGDVGVPGGLVPGTHVPTPTPTPTSLASIRTTRVVPADLNALMLRSEADLAFLAGEVRDEDVRCGTWRKDSEAAALAAAFAIAAGRRRAVINAVLWDESSRRWRDVLLDESASDPRNATTAKTYYNMGFITGTRASDYVPLFCGACERDSPHAVSVVRSLQGSGLVMPGGVATSLRRTGHQWDFPNAWAPLVHMVVEGCHVFGGEEGRVLARETARRWIKTNAQLLRTTKYMHEKYDARVMGGTRPGGGGEYAPQRGFGWTNGVVLFFLEKYAYDGDAASSRDFKLRGMALKRTLADVGAERKMPWWW